MKPICVRADDVTAARPTLARCGGHFPRATVLHQALGGGGLFVGDVLQGLPGPALGQLHVTRAVC